MSDDVKPKETTHGDFDPGEVLKEAEIQSRQCGFGDYRIKIEDTGSLVQESRAYVKGFKDGYDWTKARSLTTDREIELQRKLDASIKLNRSGGAEGYIVEAFTNDIAAATVRITELQLKLDIAKRALDEVDTLLGYVAIKFRVSGRKITRGALEEISDE